MNFGIHQISSVSMLATGQAQVRPNMQGDNSFGSVFSNIVQNSKATPALTESEESVADLADLLHILQTGSLEELQQVVREILPNVHEEDSVETLIGQMNVTSLEEIARFFHLDAEKIMHSFSALAKELHVGLAGEEGMEGVTDVWSLLEAISDNQNQVELLLRTIDNNEISANAKSTLMEFVSLLQAVQLTVRQSDLHIDQEQQLNHLQMVLQAVESQLTKQSTSQTGLPFTTYSKAHPFVQAWTEQLTQQNGQRHQEGTQEQKNDNNHITQSVVQAKNVKTEFTIQEVEKGTSGKSEALIRELQAVMKRANFGQVGGTNRMLIKLYPEHLGQLRIELLETNGLLTARILASTAVAKELLDSQMHQLRHAFNQQNLQVERIELAQAVQEPSKSDKEQAFNKQYEQQKEQQEQRQSTSDDAEEQPAFEEYLIELEV